MRVGIKETEDPVPLCYCFGYDCKAVRDDVRRTAHTDIQSKSTQRVKAGECSGGEQGARPVSPEQLATSLHISRDDATAFLQQSPSPVFLGTRNPTESWSFSSFCLFPHNTDSR